MIGKGECEMKKIAIIVPYFGKLPYNFQLWLEGCRHNSTIDWFIYTDDKTNYNYPSNVKVTYCDFSDIKSRFQSKIDFQIVLDKPYKLCDYKVSYGDMFSDELNGYDYWGYCDVDLLFGNIRKFLTDEVLEQYEKIGFQGHLTLYKNTPEVNTRYKTEISGIMSYKDIFTTTENCLFDEPVSDEMYEYLKIPVYKKVEFAHLDKYAVDFYLKHLPMEENYKNVHQVFTWNNGALNRWYIDKDGKVNSEEFMYIHFFCRKMDIRIAECSDVQNILIYPNVIELFEGIPTGELVKKKAHTSKLVFYIKYLYKNKNKISPKKLIQYVINKKEQVERSNQGVKK